VRQNANFADGFFQILPHGKHPCHSLSLPFNSACTGTYTLQEKKLCPTYKKGTQRQNIVPPENALIVRRLFRQKVFQDPQLALGLLIDAERKAAVVRVKREGLHFWNGKVQLQRRPALCRNQQDFTGLGIACPGDDVTAVPRPPQYVIPGEGRTGPRNSSRGSPPSSGTVFIAPSTWNTTSRPSGERS